MYDVCSPFVFPCGVLRGQNKLREVRRGGGDQEGWRLSPIASVSHTRLFAFSFHTSTPLFISSTHVHSHTPHFI